MSDADSLNEYFSQRIETRAIYQKYEITHCLAEFENRGFSSESKYLNNYFHQRLEQVRRDTQSKSSILCVPIPDNGSIPKILNDVFNIEAVSQMVGRALGTGESPQPDVDVDVPIEDDDHEFFETEILEGEEAGEDNRQEIRATGVLKFFDLIPDWLSNNLDASIVPFEDRWLVTFDVHLKSAGHIIVRPVPLGMRLDPYTNRRIVVTSFMRGEVNTNDNVPYPLEAELDYDPILGFLDGEIEIPGAGQRTIMAVHELYDSGNAVDEQIEALKNAEKEQGNFMNDVFSEVAPDSAVDNQAAADDEMVDDDELMEVELSFAGHRKDEINLTLEQQVVVYVDPRHLKYAEAQLADDLVFLTADMSLSFGLYNPGAPPEGYENAEKNDYLQLYLSIKEGNGDTLKDAIILRGGPLLKLAKLRLPNHLPRKKPAQPGQNKSTHNTANTVLFPADNAN
ncbi:hypothetical protein SAMN05421690_103719 [Nitrosomonas sp. Nm51]|uniref:hypothetical protein n=1 Tax=Nitrosomonas sp. Nm51 TaxID=133720 RepID=UPI0008C13579|nr:hypothetical protein [Nitrosomonas sp. Nm51]SER55263.1 hypothetical protein SAMN05421690_103719 [Nitrosomonas sp. Nm51]